MIEKQKIEMPPAIGKIADELQLDEVGVLHLPAARIGFWSTQLRKAAAEEEMGTMLIVFALRLMKRGLERACSDVLVIAAALIGHGMVFDALEKAGVSSSQVSNLTGGARVGTTQAGVVPPTASGITVRRKP